MPVSYRLDALGAEWFRDRLYCPVAATPSCLPSGDPAGSPAIAAAKIFDTPEAVDVYTLPTISSPSSIANGERK